MQELDDSSLLREYVDHDSEEAFAAIVTRHVDKVYSVALRHTRNPHQAEEITQAVFVILARQSRHLGKRVILSGWLYQTARLTCVTSIRSEIRRLRREHQAHMQTVLNENVSDVWTQIAPLLDTAMAGLKEADRHAVVLRFFDGKSMQEVGAALGANEDAAKKRVSRAVDKLRKFFSQRGVTLTAAALGGTMAANSVQAAPVGLAVTICATTVKGAALAASVTALAKGTIKTIFMTTIQKTLIAATLVVAVGTGIYEAREASRLRQRVQTLEQQQSLPVVQTGSSTPSASSVFAIPPVTNAIITPFDWRKVESDDYRKYIANLRSIGCPEDTIHDIIKADVLKLFDSRRSEILSKGKPWEYWREEIQDWEPDDETRNKLAQLNEEKRAVLKVLGVGQPNAELFADKVREMVEPVFSFLPADKRAAAMEITVDLNHITKAEEDLDASPEEKIKAQGEEERQVRAAFAKILTPQEMEDWEVRATDLSSGLRRRLATFKPTEQEFRRLFKLQQSFEEQWGKPGEPRKVAEYKNAREQLLANIQQTLGETRYADYLKTLKTK